MKNTIILFIILLFFVPFCQGQKEEKNPKNDTLQLYFPIDILDKGAHSADSGWRNAVYSGLLQTMKEPVIYRDNTNNEIYRFTWFRTFNPIVIRIEKQDNKYMLYWKQYDDVGHSSGQLITDLQKELDENTWIEFKSLLNEIDFWNLETNQKNQYSFDGSQWILEGKNSFQYHVVDQWRPNKKSKYYQICDLLIRLTGLKTSNRNKYR